MFAEYILLFIIGLFKHRKTFLGLRSALLTGIFFRQVSLYKDSLNRLDYMDEKFSQVISKVGFA
jgi:hypothetical protein